MFQTILSILFALWLVIFVVMILKNSFRYFECKGIVNLLAHYLNAAITVIGQSSFSASESLSHDKAYLSAKNRMLSQYPVIAKYETTSYSRLAYGVDDYSLIENARDIYNNLKMELNYLREEIFASFNPLLSLKHIFTIPAYFLKCLGFKPSNATSKVVNVFGAIALMLLAFFLDLYSKEARDFLNSIFNP